MGNTTSSSAPTASTHDSQYFSQQQANNEPVNATSLISSYSPRYCEYVEKVAQVLTGKTYNFEGRFTKHSEQDEEGRIYNALVMSGILNVRGINKILNEMCKKGMLVEDLSIGMNMPVFISDAAADLLRAERCQVDSNTLVCSASELHFRSKIFSFGRSLDISLTPTDLEEHSLAFSAPTPEIASVMLDDHLNLFSPPTEGTLPEECCICLEHLFLPRSDDRNVHLVCGHSLHMMCYAQILWVDGARFVGDL